MNTKWGSRLGVNMAAFLLSATLAHAQGDQLLVSNVFATQIQNLSSVFVTYDLETVGDWPVTVTLSLSTDGGVSYPHLCRSVSGDVGVGILPGISRHIFWNAGLDAPGVISANCKMRVTADDGVPDDLVPVAPGTFSMGSPVNEPARMADETQHQVTLTHGFYVQATEVTNQQYTEMAQWAYDRGYITATASGIRDNLDSSIQFLKQLGYYADYEISFSSGRFTCTKPTFPVRFVNWYGAAAYCDWLSLRQGLPRAYSHTTWKCNGDIPYTAVGYRLPTEAEWEYACRAGTQTPFSTGSCLDALTDANYEGVSPYSGCVAGPFIGAPVAVGSYSVNAFGLYDMHGNLFEWCNDWHGPYGGDAIDPAGAATGSGRVVRGGAWDYDAYLCRSAYNSYFTPDYFSRVTGIRVVRTSE